MKPVLWLLLPLGAALALFSEQPCSTCSPLIPLPEMTSLWPTPASPMKLPYPAPPAAEEWRSLPTAERLAHAKARVQVPLTAELKKQGLRLGAPAFVRIFKETKELELWLQTRGQKWQLFRSYPIAAMSGSLGPKVVEGDGQAPEGFYAVTPESLNPGSTFHLSFNVGYPNAYDRHHGRTGSFIMVHGNEVSIGCFAMTDPVIEEIYLVVEAALAGGQAAVPVHAFPFRMTEAKMTQMAEHPATAFWQELQPAYTAFASTGKVPEVRTRQGRYEVRP